MSIKDMTIAQAVGGLTLPSAAVALYVVHNFYMSLILTGDISNNIYHLDSDLAELTGVEAMYEARIEIAEENDEVDVVSINRLATLRRQMEVKRQARLLLERDLDAL